MSIEDLHNINGIQPLLVLQAGETHEVQGSGSSVYQLKAHDDHYVCSCPAWKMQKGAPVDGRTCKHLRAALGDEYEDARLIAKGVEPGAKKAAPKKRKAKAGDESAEASTSKKAKTDEVVAPGLLLANKFDVEKMKPDPTKFWVSEKLDGVRVFWDGKKLISRLGNVFHAPASFVELLPRNETLDGELFLRRNAFSDTISIVRAGASQKWPTITFMVFDIPSQATLTFEERNQHLKKLFPDAPMFKLGEQVEAKGKDNITLVDHVKCTGPDHLLSMLKKVEAVGGEGLMMRKEKSKYEGKRSATLLKVKTFYDAEAKVIGYEPGKGKYKDMTGSLRCKMESGKIFNVGSGMNDEQRKVPPAIGSIINYRFQEITKDGIPRFPTFIGEVIDKTEAKDAVLPSKAREDEEEV